MSRSPALFISHGSPMFAIQPGVLGPRLAKLGAALDAITAIVVVSPHWQTSGLRVTAAERLETIHDFGGFPQPLYELLYEPAGAPALAQKIIELFAQAGVALTADPQRGLDHGAWVPLRYVRPKADLPVLQVSLPRSIDAAGAWQLGKLLAPLREQGVLIIGSGSLTHNLYEFRQRINDPQYAQAFADWVDAALMQRDDAALINYRSRAPQAARAHPSEEHYLPLLVALGASDDSEPRTRIVGGMTDGVLSMDSFAFGLNPKQQQEVA